MRASKALSVVAATGLPADPWPIAMPRPEAPKSAEKWSLRRFFARKPPTLFQRCLAVHILHASQYGSLH